MPDLIRNALPIAPFALVPALLLMLAPLCGRRARTAFAVLLGIIAVGFVVDVVVIDHGHDLTLAVPNVFPRGAESEPHKWVVDNVTAPAWHYHIWLAAMLIVPAVVLFVRRNRAPGVPQPVVHGAGVFLYYLALRLGLEKTAAHEELVWAAGGTFALFVILPFFGWYCGRRGQGFGKFVRQLLAVAFAQRLPLVAFAYFATTRHLGTHLDTHVVTDIAPPGFGEQKLVSDFDRWLWPTAIPHLSLWIVLTLVAGLVLAVPAWLVAKRVRPAPAAH